ncbi:MAG: hypothetical protein D6731_16980 [Planctomycetota bacterium]|nr:MAG: hypothetical protein D6731_16980 [Planctomycetota bacterium]
MMDFEGLLARLSVLRERGVGGEDLLRSLGAWLPDDVLFALRGLYVERGDLRPLVRWALAELDAEVGELEAVGLVG